MLTETEVLQRKIKTPIKWSESQKILFRIAFVFFVIFCIPTKPDWYAHLIHIDWTSLHCRDLYDIASFSPSFIKVDRDSGWYAGYINWAVLLLGSIVVGLIWTVFDKKRDNYTVLYFWLRALVRYRAALGIIGFSFEKIFPTQMPYPALSNLTTDFGDFTGHKIFWQSIGISPWYQVFGGLMELIPGILLLFRRTAPLGAALLVGVLLTIVFMNLGHDGGVHIYASYFVVLGIFLLWKDFGAIHTLLIKEQPAVTYHDTIHVNGNWLKYSSVGLKIGFAVYTVVFGYLFYLNFRYDPYKQPSTPGVKFLQGIYNVKEFKLNGKEIPFSPVDTVRWQQATFEQWSTLTFLTAKDVPFTVRGSGPKSSSGTSHSSVDLEKAYEITGVAGGRLAFHYFADTVNKVLYLQDKNYTRARNNIYDPYPANWISAEAWKNIGDDNHRVHPKVWSTRRDRDFAKMDKTLIRDKMVLKYSTQNGSKVILQGTDENKDSLYIVLERIDKVHTLSKSNIQAGYYP